LAQLFVETFTQICMFLSDCGSLVPPGNGSVFSCDTLYGVTADYLCDYGYNMTGGDSNRTCDVPGNWTGQEPSCEPVGK